MLGEDWTSYELQPAPRDLLCQFRWNRSGEAAIEVAYAKDFPPEVCTTHLEWKLTGIAREQLDRMPEEVRRQVMPEPYSGLMMMSLLGRGNGQFGAQTAGIAGPLINQLGVQAQSGLVGASTRNAWWRW
jgi:hypothetical protein